MRDVVAAGAPRPEPLGENGDGHLLREPGRDHRALDVAQVEVQDVAARVLDNLLGRTEEADLRKLTEPCVIISYDLGINLRLLDAIALVPVIMAASILPISIAGWGVRESAAVVLLGQVGIAASDAVTLSVVFGLINVATACLGGLCWLVMANRHGNRK